MLYCFTLNTVFPDHLDNKKKFQFTIKGEDNKKLMWSRYYSRKDRAVWGMKAVRRILSLQPSSEKLHYNDRTNTPKVKALEKRYQNK